MNDASNKGSKDLLRDYSTLRCVGKIVLENEGEETKTERRGAPKKKKKEEEPRDGS